MASATITRRSIMGAMALAPIVAIPAAQAATHYAPRHPLDAEIDRCIAMEHSLNLPGAPDGGWDEWADIQRELLAKIEALPCAPENARIKIRAVAMIYDSEEIPTSDECDLSTDYRLAMQVVACMREG